MQYYRANCVCSAVMEMTGAIDFFAKYQKLVLYHQSYWLFNYGHMKKKNEVLSCLQMLDKVEFGTKKRYSQNAFDNVWLTLIMCGYSNLA